MKKIWYGILSLCAAILLLGQPALAAEDAADTVLGQCTQRLQAGDNNGHTDLESAFGDFMTDAMRWYGDADAAILPTGDIGNHLQIGDVTRERLADCLQRDMPLAVTSLTAAQLYKTLEHSISHYTLKEDQTVDWDKTAFDGFLQISGLRVSFNLLAPAGERILTLETEDGLALSPDDRETTLTVVTTEECLSGCYGYNEIDDYTLIGTEQEAACAYVSHLGTVSVPKNADRMTMGGLRASFAAHPRMLGGLLAIAGIVVCATVAARKKGRR